MRLRLRADDGQVLLLVLVYALLASMLVMVVVDVSKLFLYRRSLASVADGAALAAAQSLDEVTFYGQGPGETLPLSGASALAAVRGYVDRNRLPERYPGFRFEEPSLSEDGRTVTVVVHTRMELPFTGFFTGGDGTVEVTARASAESATALIPG